MSNMALPGMKNTNIKNEKASLINTADLSPKIDNKVSEKNKKNLETALSRPNRTSR